MGFADGLLAGAQTASKWVGAYDAGVKRRADEDIRFTSEEAQKAYETRRSAIDGDTNLTEFDKRQALAEARGEYYDTLQAKYEQYGRGEQFNNLINAAGNNRKEQRAHMLDMDQRAAYNQELKAQQVTGQKNFASLVDRARNSDKDALEYLNDIADYNGVQMTMKDGKFMWSPKGSDAAPVPMDMAQAYDSYTAFTSFEDRMRKRFQAEALLAGDTSKMDKHLGEQADLEKTKAVTQGLKVANKKAISDKVTYEGEGADATKVVTDAFTGERKRVTRRDGKQAHEFDAGKGTVSMKEEGEVVEAVETQLDSVPASTRKELNARTIRKGNEVLVEFNFKNPNTGKVERQAVPPGMFSKIINQIKAKQGNKGAIGTVPTGARPNAETPSH